MLANVLIRFLGESSLVKKTHLNFTKKRNASLNFKTYSLRLVKYRIRRHS